MRTPPNLLPANSGDSIHGSSDFFGHGLRVRQVKPGANSKADGRSHGWVHPLFRPAGPPSFPYGRACKIALRTAHLMAAGVLLGGHAFNAPAGQLRLWLYLAIASGVGMIALEACPSLHFVFEGWGVLLLVKLVLLAVIPFAWTARFPILLAVVALAAVGSHMPARFRHYSLLYRKVVRD